MTPRLKSCMQQPVKEMLAGFAAHGQTAGIVCARSEAALHRGADRHVFVLNLFAACDAREVALVGISETSREIEIENDFGLARPRGITRFASIADG